MQFKLENLSQDEVNLIIFTLAELPYKISFELINKIEEQCSNQLK